MLNIGDLGQFAVLFVVHAAVVAEQLIVQSTVLPVLGRGRVAVGATGDAARALLCVRGFVRVIRVRVYVRAAWTPKLKEIKRLKLIRLSH